MKYKNAYVIQLQIGTSAETGEPHWEDFDDFSYRFSNEINGSEQAAWRACRAVIDYLTHDEDDIDFRVVSRTTSDMVME